MPYKSSQIVTNDHKSSRCVGSLRSLSRLSLSLIPSYSILFPASALSSAAIDSEASGCRRRILWRCSTTLARLLLLAWHVHWAPNAQRVIGHKCAYNIIYHNIRDNGYCSNSSPYSVQVGQPWPHPRAALIDSEAAWQVPIFAAPQNSAKSSANSVYRSVTSVLLRCYIVVICCHMP